MADDTMSDADLGNLGVVRLCAVIQFAVVTA